MRAFASLLQGYRLTTAEILYHLPDHPHLLQSFLWQQLDLAPRYPELRRFLDFWARNPDTEDATAAERQARSRAFKKALGEIARQARLGFIDEIERRNRETRLDALKERSRWGAENWRAE